MRQVTLDTLDERYQTLRLPKPAAVAALRESIERHGLLAPLTVNRLADDTLVLLDGFKRLGALRLLGHAEVAVQIVELEEAVAQAAMLTANSSQHGRISELEEAWIVRSLVRSCSMTQVAVAELLGRHKSWVCRRLMLAEELATPIQDDLRLGLVSASVARELVRLPRGNQTRVSEVVRKHGLTSRQCARLVDRYLKTEAGEACDALLDDPLKYIAAADAKPPVRTLADPRLSERGDRVRQWLARLEASALGMADMLIRYPPMALKRSDRTVLAPLAADLQHCLVRVERRVRELVEATDGDARA